MLASLPRATPEELAAAKAMAVQVDQSEERLWVWLLHVSDFMKALKDQGFEITKRKSR